MASLYGVRWESSFGACDDQETGDLSQAAKAWVFELRGISDGAIAAWFRQTAKPEWPPSAPEFRKRCVELMGGLELPTIDEVAHVLALARNARGSIANRYRHPLILAVHRECCAGFSPHEAALEQIKRHIKPVYARLVEQGWPDWPEGVHEEPVKAIRHEISRSKAKAMSALRAIQESLK